MASSIHHRRAPTFGPSRRGFLASGCLAGFGWISQVARALADTEHRTAKKNRPRSLICIWLAGGPSQLETFDPQPNSLIAGGTRAVGTRIPGVRFAPGLERTAEVADRISVVRSMVTRDADHARGAYAMKTGYAPELSLVHPSIGAVVCHALPTVIGELPGHVSILGGDPLIPHQPARGGMLGSQLDAFHVGDPVAPLPNVQARVAPSDQAERRRTLEALEQSFRQGRAAAIDQTASRELLNQAERLMGSARLKAFDVRDEPARLRAQYGENPFGRGCLAARRLIEAGVRAVEVTLDGWDSHVNNHSVHERLTAVLDPALAALLIDLDDRDLLDTTVVLVAGEFGRTPLINASGGRDHWNTGFSVALTGGRTRRGVVVGATDPEGSPLRSGFGFDDLAATVLAALDLDPASENRSRDGRPVRLSLGTPIEELLV